MNDARPDQLNGVNGIKIAVITHFSPVFCNTLTYYFAGK